MEFKIKHAKDSIKTSMWKKDKPEIVKSGKD